MPQWVWPILTVLASAIGSWAAVKVSVARLEVQMDRAIKDIAANRQEIDILTDDSRVHDVELENVLNKLQLSRVRRQPLRGWER